MWSPCVGKEGLASRGVCEARGWRRVGVCLPGGAWELVEGQTHATLPTSAAKATCTMMLWRCAEDGGVRAREAGGLRHPHRHPRAHLSGRAVVVLILILIALVATVALLLVVAVILLTIISLLILSPLVFPVSVG